MSGLQESVTPHMKSSKDTLTAHPMWIDFFKTNNLVYLPKPFLKKELLEITEKKIVRGQELPAKGGSASGGNLQP